MLLANIASARSGDKGDICNIALFVENQPSYEHVRREVTAERVKTHFGGLVRVRVRRFELRQLLAFNFVLEGALDGGATRSLRLDALGKTMGAALLRLEIEDFRP